MARIRTIKPEFFRHAGLYDAEKAAGLPLRLSFAGLWTAADREGRFRWQPRALKLDCLPYDECDFSAVLEALAGGGFIRKYEIGAEVYGCIPGWKKHQVINNRESDSKIPEPPAFDACPTREPRVPDVSPTRHDPAEGEKEGEREKENSEAIASAAEAPRDFRAELFGHGLQTLARITGKGPDACRSFVGKCLKAASDDAVTVLGLIEDADRNRAVDPSAWISARLKPQPLTVNHARPQAGNIIQAADRLVETIRSFDAGAAEPDKLRSGTGTPAVRLLSQG